MPARKVYIDNPPWKIRHVREDMRELHECVMCREKGTLRDGVNASLVENGEYGEEQYIHTKCQAFWNRAVELLGWDSE